MDNEKETLVPLQVRLPQEMLDEIDELRRKQPIRPSRVQTIRWLLENAMRQLHQRKDKIHV